MTRAEFNSWFSNTDEEGIEKQRVFPGLNEDETKEVIKKGQERWNYKYLTFSDVMNQQRPCLDEFYVVVEQIACWFSMKARTGYDGGGTIVNRNRTDRTLRECFGESGYAAIMLYCFEHYSTMHEVSQGIEVDDIKYAKRFRTDVWFRLAKTLFSRSKKPPIEEGWIKAMKNLDNNPGLVKVSSSFKSVSDIDY